MKKLIYVFFIFCIGNVFSQKITYKGKIGKFPIIMELMQDGNLAGDYFYLSQNKKINLYTDDSVYTKGKIILYEKVNGVKTGFFVFQELNLESDSLKGKWFSMDGSKIYVVTLYRINK